MATGQISLHFVLMFIKKVNENCIFLPLLTALQEGGVGERGGGGVQIPPNRTELLTNTLLNNIRKPQTALKLLENFSIPQNRLVL